MSFSLEVKEELSRFNSFAHDELIKAELFGYLLTVNAKNNKNKVEFSTTSEYNINRFGKMLSRVGIEYKIRVQGKNYIVTFNKELLNLESTKIELTDEKRAVIRGAFMGSGLIHNPNNKYHLEITFISKEQKQMVQSLMREFGIESKNLERKKGYSLYIKEGETISNFLAVIGANTAVVRYEEIRVLKEKRNNINRIVNFETANLNKTISAAVLQVQAINKIKEKNKFDELPENLREIAILRLEYPEANLLELGQMLSNPIGKSGTNHRLNKLLQIAKELD